MKIFISYSRNDEEKARQVVGDCTSMGHEVWFDRELSGGQSWWNQILEQIRGCELFVFILSPTSANSTACIREYTYADALGKRVLPLLVGDVQINLLPPTLTQIHYVDYRQDSREAVIGLVRALGSLPPERSLPDPLPQPPEVPISYLGSLKAEIETSATLSFADQSALLLKLQERLRSDPSEKGVYELLRRLKQRDETYHRIAENIDELLRQERPATNPPHVPPNPTPQPPPEVPRHPQHAIEKKTDWAGIAGLVSSVFLIPILGIGLGVWSLIRINDSGGRLVGTSWAWAAIILNVLVALAWAAELGALDTMPVDYGY